MLAVGAGALDEVVDGLLADGLDATDVEAGAATPAPKEIKIGVCAELPAKATCVVTDGLCAAGVS